MNKALTLTNYWLKDIVVELNLCPFAKSPFERGLVRVSESMGSNEEDIFNDFFNELEYLNEADSNKISTTLLFFSKLEKNFFEFNDFVGELEEMLEKENLSSIFQLIVFHPEFVFVDTEFNARGNYVNRSPFPTIHIVRSAEMEMAIKESLQNGEKISFMNDQKLSQLSEDEFNKLFHYLVNHT